MNFVLIGLAFVIIGVELYPKKLIDTRISAKEDKHTGPLILYALIFEALLSRIPLLPSLHFNIFNLQIIAALTLITGFTLRLLSEKWLGRAYSYRIGKISDKLITDKGLYKYIRHPSYLGTLLYGVSILVLYPSLLTFIGFILFFTALLYRVMVEELFLKNNYAEYDQYEKSTWRILPFIY